MSELALPDPTREPIPAGWSEALLVESPGQLSLEPRP